jgi:hypothetical protein
VIPVVAEILIDVATLSSNAYLRESSELSYPHFYETNSPPGGVTWWAEHNRNAKISKFIIYGQIHLFLLLIDAISQCKK